jgi:periplasmic protein CpxP/Spy
VQQERTTWGGKHFGKKDEEIKMTKKRLTTGVLAFAAALMLGVGVYAQHEGGPHGPGGPGFGHGRGGHGGPGDMLGHFARELNLTDAQQAQVKQLVEAFHEKNKALLEQGFRDGGPFEGLSEGFDEAAVRAAAQSRAAAHAELEVAHAKLMSQVYALLTTEQKAKVAELKTKFEQHRQQGPPPPPGVEN